MFLSIKFTGPFNPIHFPNNTYWNFIIHPFTFLKPNQSDLLPSPLVIISYLLLYTFLFGFAYTPHLHHTPNIVTSIVVVHLLGACLLPMPQCSQCLVPVLAGRRAITSSCDHASRHIESPLNTLHKQKCRSFPLQSEQSVTCIITKTTTSQRHVMSNTKPSFNK